MTRHPFKRSDRVAELIQRELACLIQHAINDPRLAAFITLSAVKVSKDLAHATIYFTVLNEDPVKTAAILNSASRYLRTLLAKTCTLRTMPLLHFRYDESVEYGKRLSQLIDDANNAQYE